MNRMEMFENDAENFLGFGGNVDSFVGGENYYGGNGQQNYMSAMGGQQNYMSAMGGQAPQNALGVMDDSDRTLTVTIVNANVGASKPAFIFGANKYATQDADITVTVSESSHDEVREDSKSNPFLVVGFKMFVSDATQFANSLTIQEATPSGATTTRDVSPYTFRSAQNNIATQIDAPAWALSVSGRTAILLDIIPSGTVTFIFTLRTRGNMENILKGQNTLDVSTGKAPTGLPQIDLFQGRRI